MTHHAARQNESSEQHVAPASIWRNGDFRLIWIRQTVSIFGDRVTELALPWLVLLYTHSPLDTGLTFTAGQLPALIFSPIVGVVADRWERRHIMVACNVASALALLSLIIAAGACAWLGFAGSFWMALVGNGVLDGCIALAFIIVGAASSAVTPSTVLGRVTAACQMLYAVVRGLGPLAAGAGLARWGASPAFIGFAGLLAALALVDGLAPSAHTALRAGAAYLIHPVRGSTPNQESARESDCRPWLW